MQPEGPRARRGLQVVRPSLAAEHGSDAGGVGDQARCHRGRDALSGLCLDLADERTQDRTRRRYIVRGHRLPRLTRLVGETRTRPEARNPAMEIA